MAYPLLLCLSWLSSGKAFLTSYKMSKPLKKKHILFIVISLVARTVPSS